MRIGDLLYFAPGVPFTQLPDTDAELVELWRQRIEGYYLEPAELCANQKYGFACGLLVLAAIDAIARYEYTPRRVGRRNVGTEFKAFVESEIPGFERSEDAQALYELFRNGLVHEARLKAGAEFSLESVEIMECFSPVVRVNPQLLLHETRNALNRFMMLIAADQTAQRTFANLLRADFTEEIKGEVSYRTT